MRVLTTMPETLDISSVRHLPAIVREVDLSDTVSTASGSDCSSNRTSIKIRILPRTTAWNRTPVIDESRAPVSVVRPSKRSVFSFQIRQQLNQHLRQQPAETGLKRHRMGGVKRFAFSCLSAKPGSVEYCDVAADDGSSNDVTLLSHQLSPTTEAGSESTRQEQFTKLDIVKSSTTAASSSFSSTTPAAAATLPLDLSRKVNVGQKFSVSFSTASALPAIERNRDDRLCATTSFSSVLFSSSDIRNQHQDPMSKTGIGSTLACQPVTRRHQQPQSQLSWAAGSHQVVVKNPTTSERGSRRHGRTKATTATSSGGTMASRTLSSFEALELDECENIYYIGEAICERKWKDTQTGETQILTNNGQYYDDNEGFYSFIPHDHIAYRLVSLKHV